MIQEKVWSPTQRQTSFLSIPDSVYEALYGGAAGGGKSEALLMLPIARGFYQDPRFKGILFRRTYPELEREIIIRSHDWYTHCGASYSDDKKRWKFPSGAVMQFGHLEYENDVRKYDTAEYNYIGWDELTSFTEYQYKYMFSRSRSASSNLPSICRAGTNPGNVGHGWVRARFVEPAPFGTIILDKVTGLKRIFIQSKVQDNPHIMENDPGYIQRLQGMPEADRRAKLDGDWWTFSGQVFDDWRAEHFPDEPENAVHVIDPFVIPDWWPRIISVDWGFAAMMCALWGAISPEGRLYIYREYTAKQTKVSTWGTEIRRLSQYEKFVDVVLCHSAWQKRGDALTMAEQFEEYSGLRPRQADNERLGGKILVQEYLRWRPRPAKRTLNTNFNKEYADKVLRNYGVTAYEQYMGDFRPETEDTNIPRLQVFRTCVELIKCIPLCIYDAADRNGKPSEDVREFHGDDPYDDLRYLCKAAEFYLEKINSGESEHRDKVETILSDFARDRDWTRLHRRMEFLGANDSLPVPVRRFHRVRMR